MAPISPAGGVDVLDIDLNAPLGTDVALGLRALLDSHGVLRFRDQDLSPESQVVILSCFDFISQWNMAGKKKLFIYVSNNGDAEAALPFGRKGFHQDFMYTEDPIRVTSLYGEEVGAKVPPTIFRQSQACILAAVDISEAADR